MLRSDTIEHVEDLTPLLPAWDELALACRRPYGTPAWMLAWWRHLAPPGAALCVVAIRDGEELTGIAPMYVAPEGRGVRHVRLLGARGGGTPLGPIARTGDEATLARHLGEHLGGMRPAPHVLHLDGVPADGPWSRLIGGSWSTKGRPLVQLDARRPTPTVRADGATFEEWFGSKSRNFRQEMRRKRRQLEDAGATFRMAGSLQEVDRDLEGFVRLHASRWDWRGGSGRLQPGTKAFLLDVAATLLPAGRFRLWSIDVGGVPISTHVFVSGGGRANYWLGGFDDAWARYSPAMVTLLAAIEHAFGAGDTEVGLGAGRQEYKGRFTADVEHLDWVTLVPGRSFASPRVWAWVVPGLAGRGVSNRLSPTAKGRLKGLVRRSEGKGA